MTERNRLRKILIVKKRDIERSLCPFRDFSQVKIPTARLCERLFGYKAINPRSPVCIRLQDHITHVKDLIALVIFR